MSSQGEPSGSPVAKEIVMRDANLMMNLDGTIDWRFSFRQLKVDVRELKDEIKARDRTIERLKDDVRKLKVEKRKS